MAEVIPRRRKGGVYKRGDRWWGSWTGSDGTRQQKPLLAQNYPDAVNEVAGYRKRAREVRMTGQAPPSNDNLASVLPRYLSHQ